MRTTDLLILLLVHRCAELERKADTDSLTGALSQSALIDVWGKRGTGTTSIIAIDVMGLKQTNEMLGHDAGDRLLQNVVASIRKIVGDAQVYRRGGDEFVVVLPPEKLSPTVNEIKAIQLPIYLGVASGSDIPLERVIQQAFAQVESQKGLQ
jgi:diguanylate cyclase (GGDEF)-like protein